MDEQYQTLTQIEAPMVPSTEIDSEGKPPTTTLTVEVMTISLPDPEPDPEP